MIPKVIYQTWKTKDLPANVRKVIDSFLSINKEYHHILFDDNDMDNFIQQNFNEYIYNCYRQLNVGAAKADFWRYCILYLYGGVYLDIDADITGSLDELINEDDIFILTREANPGYFNNWFMISAPGHPILKRCIELCCENIQKKHLTDICHITGPHGPLTRAVNEILIPIYYKKSVNNLYYENDVDLNTHINSKNSSIRCKFFNIDMGKFGKWKHNYEKDLYEGTTYWRDEKIIFR